MKYSEQKEVVENLRALADFYERPRSIGLPAPSLRFAAYINEWSFHDGSYQFDEQLSRAKLRKIARALGPHEKKFEDSYFRLVKPVGPSGSIIFSVQREAVCEAKQVGTRTIPAMPATEEKEVPVYEYVCSEVSLLKV